MADVHDIREGEVAVEPPPARDAGLIFIGRIRTPWATREQTPKQGKTDGPVCAIEIFEPWTPALQGLEQFSHAQVVYWLHLARRDLVLQSPKHDVEIVDIEANVVRVRGLDCVDGTPLIDLKPDHCAFSP